MDRHYLEALSSRERREKAQKSIIAQNIFKLHPIAKKELNPHFIFETVVGVHPPRRAVILFMKNHSPAKRWQ